MKGEAGRGRGSLRGVHTRVREFRSRCVRAPIFKGGTGAPSSTGLTSRNQAAKPCFNRLQSEENGCQPLGGPGRNRDGGKDGEGDSRQRVIHKVASAKRNGHVH